MSKNQTTPKESKHEQPNNKGLDAVTCSAERIARELALNYYQGCYRERYSNQQELTRVTGVLVVGTVDAERFVERTAREHADLFWKSWESEAAELLLPKRPVRPLAYPTCHHCKGRMTHTMRESWCSDCGFISNMNGCGWPHEGDEDDLRDSPPNAEVRHGAKDADLD